MVGICLPRINDKVEVSWTILCIGHDHTGGRSAFMVAGRLTSVTAGILASMVETFHSFQALKLTIEEAENLNSNGSMIRQIY